uniref:Uncharacterized protein n=1 Tax=Oryza meridionalis TaxID=40149 RepID=A0A0E0ECR7_9ORYZ
MLAREGGGRPRRCRPPQRGWSQNKDGRELSVTTNESFSRPCGGESACSRPNDSRSTRARLGGGGSRFPRPCVTADSNYRGHIVVITIVVVVVVTVIVACPIDVPFPGVVDGRSGRERSTGCDR